MLGDLPRIPGLKTREPYIVPLARLGVHIVDTRTELLDKLQIRRCLQERSIDPRSDYHRHVSTCDSRLPVAPIVGKGARYLPAGGKKPADLFPNPRIHGIQKRQMHHDGFTSLSTII
ncbi:hypothetical protein GCM10007923_57440 [Shinella yambaruensis]|uniref:Uncharacterized protein n=1 Tax=Shinella yambaruensis TaxID=415996 RepID=A0ABQ5ZRZ2_9HYPH|nr:hypothetical protein GCM10007923_57440 [Shinella yambaruensis]